MKKILILPVLLCFLLPYKVGKIQLQDGSFFEGKNLIITEDKIAIDISKDITKSFNKSEIKNAWKGNPTLSEKEMFIIKRHPTTILLGIGGLMYSTLVVLIDINPHLSSNEDNYNYLHWFIGIPISISIGYYLDYNVFKEIKYENLTQHWELVYSP